MSARQPGIGSLRGAFNSCAYGAVEAKQTHGQLCTDSTSPICRSMFILVDHLLSAICHLQVLTALASGERGARSMYLQVGCVGGPFAPVNNAQLYAGCM